MKQRSLHATVRRSLPALAAALLPVPLLAQVPDSIGVPVDSVVITPAVPVVAAPVDGDLALREPLSPRSAFIRSMILPGWGQAEFGSYVRGGVFFAGWAGNWFMNFKNVVRLNEARNRFDLRAGELRDSLVTTSSNPDSMRTVVEITDLLDTTVRADSAGNDLRKLVRGREQQREDWIAFTIFWILASGVDGYVTAHLADFPATIDVDTAMDGGVSLRLEVPLGRRRP